MTRRKNLQTPLGELLTKARLSLGWSRAQLSKETGIAEASLMRYERAGLEEDGQYPPAPKLAKLCFELDLNPLQVLMACLQGQDYWRYKSMTWENWLLGHPDYEFLSDQFIALNNDNRKLRVLVDALLIPPEERTDADKAGIEYLTSEAKKIFEAQRRYEDAAHFFFRKEKVSLDGIFIPGLDHVVDGDGNPIEGGELDHSASDYARMRSGPNHEGSDRLSSPDHPEAASTASASTRPQRPEENSE